MGHFRSLRCPVCKKQSEEIDASAFIARRHLRPTLFRIFFVLGWCPRCDVSFAVSKLDAVAQRLFSLSKKTEEETLHLSPTECHLSEEVFTFPTLHELPPAALANENNSENQETQSVPAIFTPRARAEQNDESGLKIQFQVRSWKLQFNFTVEKREERAQHIPAKLSTRMVQSRAEAPATNQTFPQGPAPNPFTESDSPL